MGARFGLDTQSPMCVGERALHSAGLPPESKANSIKAGKINFAIDGANWSSGSERGTGIEHRQLQCWAKASAVRPTRLRIGSEICKLKIQFKWSPQVVAQGRVQFRFDSHKHTDTE